MATLISKTFFQARLEEELALIERGGDHLGGGGGLGYLNRGGLHNHGGRLNAGF